MLHDRNAYFLKWNILLAPSNVTTQGEAGVEEKNLDIDYVKYYSRLTKTMISLPDTLLTRQLVGWKTVQFYGKFKNLCG